MLRLKELREDHDLRQSDVSKATGIDQKTISNYETGKTRPDSEALILLADYFNVSIDYLVGRKSLNCNNSADLKNELKKCIAHLNNIKELL